MTPNTQTIRERISEILVKWNMPTRQVAINEIVSLFPVQGENRCKHGVHGTDCFECFPKQVEVSSENCEHGVAKKYCFNCRYTEKFGMKIEMFNNHHYVRLKDVEAHHSDLKQRVEGMKGLSRNPDYFIKLKRRLNGNIAMKDVDDFQLTQIAWEAKDLTLDAVLTLLETNEKETK